MTWWQALVLGVVQGLTEFLPISSSGHLVLAEELIGFSSPGVIVEVVLHVATLAAVLLVYRSKLSQLLMGTLRREPDAMRYVGAVVIATIPAVVVGLGMKDMIESAFDSLAFVGVDLLVTGCILWSTRRVAGAAGGVSGIKNPLLIGLAQALAILPGISRSGSTISAAMWLRVTPEAAAEFSFIMAIPAIAGAAVLQLPHVAETTGSIGVAPLAIGAAASLLTGVAAIALLVRLLQRGAFHRFAPYCWALGGAVLVVHFWG